MEWFADEAFWQTLYPRLFTEQRFASAAADYFETPDQDLDVLRNVKASLKKDGIFLIDVIGKEYLASRTCRTLWEESPEGELFIQHCDILPGWSRVRLQWLLIKKDRTLRFELEHNLYSGQEMVALLRKAGFSDVQIFGSLAGTPYDSSATRLVARARS